MHTSHLRRLASWTGVALTLTLAACAPDALLRSTPVNSPRRSVTPVATIIVTTAAGSGPGSLTAAMSAAVDNDVIGFLPSLAGQTIHVPNASGFFRSFSIDGSAAPNLVVSGDGKYQVFAIMSGETVTISNIAIEDGFISGDGGCVINEGTLTLDHVRLRHCFSVNRGAGIANFSSLTVRNSTITENHAVTNGGGIYSDINSPLTIEDSEITGNLALAGAGVLSAHDGKVRRSLFRGNTAYTGAAIYASSGEFLLENSTISADTSTLAGGSAIAGGTTGVVSIVNSTIVNNVSASGTPAVLLGAGLFTIKNSILAFNGRNCGSAVLPTLAGTNLADDISCGAASPTMLIGNPLLGALVLNGGPTASYAILAGSPALDGATECSVSEDQRRVARPQGTACDIGAVEFTDYVQATLTIDPSGTVNSKTGIMYITGTAACTKASTLVIEVQTTQLQKAGKVNTALVANNTISVSCGLKGAWAAALTPATGAFNTSLASVTASTSAAQKEVTATSVRADAIKLSWTKK
jgi:hypothetical protein